MKDEKLVRDDNSEPSDPNQRSADLSHCPLPDWTQHTCAHRHAHTCAHTSSIPTPSSGLALPIILNLASTPSLWLHTTAQLTAHDSSSCLRPMSHLLPCAPQALPTPCHRSSRPSSRPSCSGGPCPGPSPHQGHGHRLAIAEATQGLADRAVLVCATAAKLEGRRWFCKWGQGAPLAARLPQSPMPPPDAAFYPTAPLASGHVHMQLGLEILGVVEGGQVCAAGLQAL